MNKIQKLEHQLEAAKKQEKLAAIERGKKPYLGAVGKCFSNRNFRRGFNIKTGHLKIYKILDLVYEENHYSFKYQYVIECITINKVKPQKTTSIMYNRYSIDYTERNLMSANNINRNEITTTQFDNVKTLFLENMDVCFNTVQNGLMLTEELSGADYSKHKKSDEWLEKAKIPHVNISDDPQTIQTLDWMGFPFLVGNCLTNMSEGLKVLQIRIKEIEEDIRRDSGLPYSSGVIENNRIRIKEFESIIKKYF